MSGNTLPPLWKIWRELRRALVSLPSLPWATITRYTATPFYDLFLARRIIKTEGALQPSDRIAVYLVYPSSGVQPSHLVSLQNIIDSGYTPLVVSNIALSEADLALLRPKCWRILSRPNYGYDFGGYRDAILHLEPMLPNIKRLALLNDSVWFPLQPHQQWLLQAESTGRDFAGAICFENSGRKDADTFRETIWSASPRHKDFHYGSFALSIGPAMLRSERFLRFWKRYPQTARKGQTIRLGEIGLTQFVIRHGFSHAATCDLANLPTEIALLSDDRLDQVFRRLITMQDRRFIELHADLENSDTDRATKEKFIIAAAKRIGPSYALAEFLVHEKGLQFLKKSPAALHPASAAATLAIAADIPGPITPVVVDEATRLSRRLAQTAG